MRIIVDRDWKIYTHTEHCGLVVWIFFGVVKLPYVYVQQLGHAVMRHETSVGDRYMGIVMGSESQWLEKIICKTMQEAIDAVITYSFGAAGYLRPEQRERWLRVQSTYWRSHNFLKELKLYEAGSWE